jgi:hypothetical protein
MSEPTFKTAAEVFHHAEIEHGNALGNMILASIGIGKLSLPRARAEVAITLNALTEAARFAAKNFTPSVPPPAPLLDRANNATWIETKTTNEKEI